MAPLKFEEHLRDKLKERDIKPSKNVWAKIANGLEQQEKPKKIKMPYYAIAACLIGLVIATVWFVNKAPETGSTPQIVDVEPKVDQELNLVKPKTESDQEQLVETIVKAAEKQETIAPLAKKQPKNIPKQRLSPETSPRVIVQNEAKSVPDFTDSMPGNSLVDTKLSGVMQKLALLEKNNIVVSDAEVDALLRKAQQEILTEKAVKAGISVDAMALLLEVEDELDKTFRDQIFDNLKKGYLKLKTAVADRNN
ncbi:hypothetical protein MWU65_02650 [Cellulophaga sp. F20128]|uniref:hypothetical protein n=1 Tax=Cellulophaga sp. F20128 TaxID=2926413 RepID=UPI001FF5193D|nr:hypothetical protein [Cellulophaga sp. F20128]MCK0156061.1 hypothetical protein [Cellulophaga sp. F20128]